MPMVVLTGPVRSGKSAVAAHLAATSERHVVVAVAGRGEADPEMERRIARHRQDRPGEWTTMEVAGRSVSEWVAEVPAEACLVVDCLGTLISDTVFMQMDLHEDEYISTQVEDEAESASRKVVDILLERRGFTVLVTNEVGWGVVPVTAAGRLFRDVMGRVNRMAVDAADAAYLVVCGRCIDITAAPLAVDWPNGR